MIFRNKLLAFVLTAVVLMIAGYWSGAWRLGSPMASATGTEPTAKEEAAALPMELFGTMGKEEKLLPGKEITLFEQAGAGTLTHMWFGGDWPGWGNTRIRVYVDAEKKAGIDMA